MSIDFERLALCDADVSYEGWEIEECSLDYGRIECRRPRAVMRPRTADDIAALISEARRRGFHVAARGRGHSVRGQSLAPGGVVVDMRALSKAALCGSDTISAEGGADWQSVLDCSLPGGAWPPVIPNYLGLSIGGTLSVGGIGEATFRHGLIADAALSLDVVTGTGELLTCSAHHNGELFAACKAGLGQFGIITRALLALVPAPSRVTIFHLLYAAAEPFVSDVERLALTEPGLIGLRGLALPNRRDHLEYALGAAHRSVWVSPDRFPWLFLLTATYSGEADPGLIEQLNSVPGAMRIEHLAGKDIAATAPVNRALSHPWVDLLIPGSEAPRFVRETLDRFGPAGVGGPILLYPIVRSRIQSSMFQLPDSEFSILLSVSRAVDAADSAELASALTQNRDIYTTCRKSGGMSYPIGSLGFDETDWQSHFGKQWTAFKSLKKFYDPGCILAPGQKIY